MGTQVRGPRVGSPPGLHLCVCFPMGHMVLPTQNFSFYSRVMEAALSLAWEALGARQGATHGSTELSTLAVGWSG